jgi:hypothetical protein
VPHPAESHHVFGAGFLFMGVLMLVETLSGRVWYRSRIRTLIFPGAILFLGEGLFVVTLIEPSNRPIHFMLGTLMLLAGWFEARYRLGQVPRATADMFVIPALLAGGLEVGVFHSHGALTSGSFSVHVLMGLTSVAMAAVRYFQSRAPLSMPRSAYMSLAIIALALELFWDADFH